jgi:MOSC domain-containing protein YiiM
MFFDLDLSAANLPIGVALRAGAALLEVSPKAHNGCHKFKAASAPTRSASLRTRSGGSLNLRGSICR